MRWVVLVDQNRQPTNTTGKLFKKGRVGEMSQWDVSGRRKTKSMSSVCERPRGTV